MFVDAHCKFESLSSFNEMEHEDVDDDADEEGDDVLDKLPLDEDVLDEDVLTDESPLSTMVCF